MSPRIGLAAALAATLSLAAGFGSYLPQAQAGPVLPAPQAAAPAVAWALPEPQAPFDETPITPMETVGARHVD